MTSLYDKFLRLAAVGLLMIGLTPMDLSAETVQIRSGEHVGFTRLVLEPETTHDWQLGRTTTGYELRMTGEELSFATEDIFRKIPRRRISDVTRLPRPGALALKSSCVCFAKATQLPGGAIVIDIADGAPPANSPFERPLDEVPETTPPPSLPHPGQTRRAPSVESGGATLSFRPTVNDAASLPIYWRDVMKTNEKPAASDPGPQATAPSTTQVPEANLPLFPVPSVPVEIGPPPLSLPSQDVLAAESELLRQLSRAATQGMVTLAEPNNSRPSLPHPTGAPDDLAQPDVEIAFHAETSMDRDASANPMAHHLTAQGDDCLSDEMLAVAGWGTDEPAALQLTRARDHLTGEFDRPDPSAVRTLARLYLHLGMGAEARQTLRAFNDQSDEAKVLISLARIIDDQEATQADPLVGMQACDTAAALWAFLARPADATAPVNAPAVLRAFSGLPAALRTALGQRLSDRFIRAANPDAAHDIRSAMARSAGTTGNRNLGMVDASLALDASDTAPALKKLDQLAQGNDGLAVEAAMTALRSRLDRDETIDPKQVDSIAALAFEHGDGVLGATLATLEIEARASAADYGGAARRLEERQAEYPDMDLRPLARKILARLAARADDAAFLQLYFHQPSTFGAALADPAAGSDAILPVAGRLAQLGFATEARALLSGPTGQTDQGKIILARLALAEFAPGEALGLLEGLLEPDAARLRAEALLKLKNYGAAATQLAKAGTPQELARALWQSGNWQQAAAIDDTYRAVADGLGLTDAAGALAPDARPTEATTSLASSKAAVADSAALRQTIATLLAPPVPAND